MSDLTKPVTTSETYMAAITGDYDGPLPVPVTRTHEYLKKICENSTGITEDITALQADVVSLKRHSISFRHGKGTFAATAEGDNISWQYGAQTVQGNNCTFVIKSDNALIKVSFDALTNLSVDSNKSIKLDLSDLGGKIAYYLNLYGCTGITGDLSDLGGKIAYYLNLYGCTGITGDLSDLGGKIAYYLNLYGCTGVTGVYYGTAYPKIIYISKTSITAEDMDQNLINFANSNVTSGKFTATGMLRTAASDDAVATLVTRGWTVSGLTKVEE